MKNHTAPRITVAIPAYNSAATLPRAIRSVFTQTFQDYEILVIDDGSIDETPALLADLQTQPGGEKLRIVTHPQNQGRSAARNTAFLEARGQYLAWLDADDEYLPGKLAAQLAAIEKLPGEIKACFCAHTLLQGGTQNLVLEEAAGGDWQRYCACEKFRVGPGLTLMISTIAFGLVGGFDPELVIFEDWDWFWRFTKIGAPIVVVPESHALRHHSGLRSAANIEANTLRFLEKHAADLDALGACGRKGRSRHYQQVARYQMMTAGNRRKCLHYLRLALGQLLWLEPSSLVLGVEALTGIPLSRWAYRLRYGKPVEEDRHQHE